MTHKKCQKIFLKNAEKIYEPPLTLRVTRKIFRTPKTYPRVGIQISLVQPSYSIWQISIRTIETNTKQQANHI